MSDSTPPEMPSNIPSRLNTVYRLFLIPLAIVVVSVGLFYAFGRLTFETKKPDDYLYEIKTAGEAKKWQAAYSLAGMLVTEKNIPDDVKKEYTKQIIPLVENKNRYSVHVRTYLLLALGYLKQKESVSVLLSELKDSEEDIVLYSVWALAVIGDTAALEKITPLVDDTRPAIRKISAFALGTFGDQKAVPALQKILKDPVPDVSWNAALSLAALGDSSGSAVLERLLDRNYLNTFAKLSEKEKEGILLNVIKSISKIGLKEARPKLEELSKKDSSLKVRQAALEGLGALV
ncbi:MAG: HEAT repeat domain-containing protein [Candidatus Omnitrophica bacterium]|nr:HEAT repeat domain-containing protein [Candidatus Omnitrophota bacterium]